MSELYLENEPRKPFNAGDRISVIVLDPRDDGKQSFSRWAPGAHFFPDLAAPSPHSMRHAPCRRLAYKDGRMLGDEHEASNDLAAAA